jgi:hypothetical protein
LIDVDWAGADLSGATLTGANLHGVLRFGIKTEGITCNWVDLSPAGDQSMIHRLTSEDLIHFFHEIPPSVQIAIDATLDLNAYYALAVIYHQTTRHHQVSFKPPNIQLGRRRTLLTFEMERDDQLFLVSALAILPFEDASNTQRNLLTLMKLLRSSEVEDQLHDPERLKQLSAIIDPLVAKISGFKLAEITLKALSKVPFCQAPTRTTLVNSDNQTLTIYKHPMFAKRIIDYPDAIMPAIAPIPEIYPNLPPLETLVNFVRGFHRP